MRRTRPNDYLHRGFSSALASAIALLAGCGMEIESDDDVSEVGVLEEAITGPASCDLSGCNGAAIARTDHHDVEVEPLLIAEPS